MESPSPEQLADLVDMSDEPQQDDLRLRSLAIDIIIHPISAMRRLAAHPGRRWLWPMLVLLIVGLASTAASLPTMLEASQRQSREATFRQYEENPEAFGDMTADEVVELTSSGAIRAFTMASALIGVAVSVVLGMVVVAALIHFFGTVLGGQQTYSQMFTVVSWAHVPLVFRGLLQLVNHALGRFDMNPAGLSGLVACQPLDADCQASLMQPVLAQIEVWNLWYWFLLVAGVAIVCHVSRRKAFAVVAVLVLLQVLLGLSGVLVTRQLSGLFG